ncbi:MAG: Asp/Glu/Hydantoin racemase family protein [Chlamydiales bacterium]|jgi:aspartate racemase|nr:Asp/Glu/Hydantoin racemase family protein [Chlamydiales bacterium]
MSRKKIGIIGGAGPMAGALMFQQIVEICQTEYNCQKDFDFPEIILHSYPFSEMLSADRNPQKIQRELTNLAQSLDVGILLIACNTLHAFIDADFPQEKCIQIPDVVRDVLSSIPKVICSSTSRQSAIHQASFACVYPSIKVQEELDEIIASILKGHISDDLSERLSTLILEEGEKAQPVVLGCTEFSLLHSRYPIPALNIIDPSYLLAKKACQAHFIRHETYCLSHA